MLISEKTITFAAVIELSRHIEILLLSNDCVVVPGLGGFVAHHVTARYDAGDGLFLPPLRTLGFNPQLTMNDSLLVQSYVECYDLSYPEALRRIQQEVEELRIELETRGEYELNDIGRLYVNDNGKMAFTPCEAGILTPAIYGLSSYEMTPIQMKNEEEKPTSQQPATAPTGKERKARIVAITNDEQTGQKMLSISVNALRNAAVAAVVIAAFFLIVSPLNYNPKLLQTEQIKSSISFDTFSNATKSIKLVKKEIPIRPTQAATPVIKKQHPTVPQQAVQTTAPASAYWSIVLCSHVTEPNANWFCQELAKEGISASVNTSQQGNVKVLYGHYASKEKAQEALHDMQGNQHFKQAWVLEITNKN